MDKKQQLIQKKQTKMNLRDHSHIKPKKFIEYDQEEEEKHIESKSRRWWQKINKKYFPSITPHELQCLRNTILEDYYVVPDHAPFKQWSYFNCNLMSRNPKLFEKKCIKVLFQNNDANNGCGDSLFVTYSFGLKDTEYCYEENYSSIEHDRSVFVNTTVTYMKQQQPGADNTDEQFKQICEQVYLNFSKSSGDIDFLTQCNYYDLTKYHYYHCEIDREIDLWQAELRKLDLLNQNAWKLVFQNFQTQLSLQKQSPMTQKLLQGYNIEQDVTNINEFLLWQHNLVNFKHGFSDKNEQMLAEALEGMWIKEHKTKNMGEKKKFFKASLQNLMQTKSQLSNTFQTDCKVCFSTYVSDKNKVIYCDQCNQSFHENCYGIEDLNQDPNSKFYCDPCHYIMGNHKNSEEVPKCQICFVPFSPLKKIGSFFFHPSCLFLNNLLKPKRGCLQLQEEVTPQTIVSYIKDFQKLNKENQCEFCSQNCKRGLRFKCSQSTCNKYFHILCGYLNAVVINISRKDKKLEVQIKCSQHFSLRQTFRQAYLRRFFCNYKNIADLSQKEFIQIYKEELESIREQKKQMNSEIKRKFKTKKQHKKKQQLNSYSQHSKSVSIIDLNEEDQENKSFSDNHCSSTLEVNSRKCQNNQKDQLKIASYELKMNIQRLASQYFERKRNFYENSADHENFLKLKKNLQTINVDFNWENNELKYDDGYLADLNTNTNDSDNIPKKIIEQ